MAIKKLRIIDCKISLQEYHYLLWATKLFLLFIMSGEEGQIIITQDKFKTFKNKLNNQLQSQARSSAEF